MLAIVLPTDSPRRRVALTLASLLAVLLATACSSTAVGVGSPEGEEPAPANPASDPQYAALFGPPASSELTPGSLSGLWSDTDSGNVRLRIDASSLVVAFRCSGQAIGGEFAARVTATSLRVVESKQVGTGSCYLTVKPIELQACGDIRRSCFLLSGTTLSLYDASGYLGALFYASQGGAPGSFTKLSD